MLPGKYKAIAQDIAFGKADTGASGVRVNFKLIETGELIDWTGYLTPAAIDRTIESLIYIGYDEDLPDGERLKNAQVVELTIENEEYKGKTKTKVKWVNKSGSSKFDKSPETANLGINLGSLMKGARSKLGEKKPVAVMTQKSFSEEEDKDPIPF